MRFRCSVCLAISFLSTVVSAQAPPQTLTVTVTNVEGDPIEGVKVFRSVWTDEKDFDHNTDFVTDANGQAKVTLPQSMRLLRIWFNKDGYAPLFANWDESTIDSVSDSLSIALPEGTTIGGEIVDQNGEPISDATIEVYLRSGGDRITGNPNVGYGTSLAERGAAVRTDAQGRWSLTAVPPGDDVELWLKIGHDQYIQDESWGGLQSENGITTAQLRDQTARIVMQQGVVLQGQVIGEDSKPVAGATISWSDRRRWGGSPQVTSDDEGNYRTPPVAPGSYHLAIVAENHQPFLKQLDVSDETDQVDVELNSGKELKIRVVDVQGRPIEDASVRIQRWRLVETSIIGGECKLFAKCKISNTDDQGRTTWRSAPTEAVRLLVQKRGHSSEHVELVASDKTHTVTLHESVKITGTVVDAATKRPIADAKLIPVSYYTQRPNDPIVQRTQIRRLESGEFEYTAGHWQEGIDLVLQFEAEGYRPQRIGPYDKTSGSIETQVHLEPASMLRGRVVDPDGNPVPDATVSFTDKDTSLIVNDWTYEREGLSTRTDDSGDFAIGATMYPPVVIATHESGYAEVALELDQQPGLLKLQPWSKVEGTLVREGNPVVGVRIYLNPIRMLGGDNPHVQDSFSTVTDAEGRFTFHRVPPVPSKLWPYFSVWSETKLTSSQNIPLDLQPGQTYSLSLGSGAVVRGKVVPAGDIASTLDMNYCLNYFLKRAPGVEPPEPIRRAGFDWKRGWSFDLRDSQEGRGFLSTLPHHFVKFQSDGTFEIHGVQPGDYQFAISIYEPPEGCLIDPVGLRVVDVAVGKEDQDVGTIEVDVKLGPQVGEKFPNFRFEKLSEGETGSITDFQGKYLLVDFWATWCAPCIKQLPDLRAAAERWDSDRVTVLSVSLDEQPDHAREFIYNREMNWPQALLAGRDNPIVRQQLGISSVPIHYVLDQEGRILHRSFQLDDAVRFIDDKLK